MKAAEEEAAKNAEKQAAEVAELKKPRYRGGGDVEAIPREGFPTSLIPVEV